MPRLQCVTQVAVLLSVAIWAHIAWSMPAVADQGVRERTVAMTFDDLPMASSQHGALSFKAAEKANRAILRALRRHKAPATGFVTEIRIAELGSEAAILIEGWNRGAFELANHGFSHADIHTLDIDAIEREIVQGEATIVPMARSAGRSVRFFRFPYNHLGDTSEKQSAVYRLLAEEGYQLAAATIDTSDYLFNEAYERALSERDRKMQSKIKRAYLDYTGQQIAYYAELNRRVLDYEPPAIMLLHVNRLNAVTLDDQLRLFENMGYRFVSLAEAQSDPAYAVPPQRATRFGPMWGYRWARDRKITVDGSLEGEPPAWVGAYASGERAN
jgi:peptidoglycan/xylan/chitin deacetylase (PgdA/CDA1 family)